MRNYKIYVFTILASFLSLHPLLSEPRQIWIARFEPLTAKDERLASQIQARLKLELERYNYRVYVSQKSARKLLASPDVRSSFAVIAGFYTKQKSTLRLYGQIYHPSQGYLLDALVVSSRIEGLEDLKLPDQTDRSPAETRELFAKRLAVRIRTNPNRKERHKRLREYVTQRPELSRFALPVRTVSKAKESEEAFKILQETRVTSAARKSQSLEEAPSNVTVITAEQIRRRGYLTLTELLQDVAFIDFQAFNDTGEFPTHFLLRGQGDVGQTKVLIMENGIVQNDVNFGWSRNMQYNIALVDVDRVEIVQGPVSGLYGANAYVGVINVITKKGKTIYPDREDSGLYLDLQALYGAQKIREPAEPWTRTQYAPLFQKSALAETRSAEGMAAYKWESGLIFQIAFRRFVSDGDQGYGRPDPGKYFTKNYEPEKVQTASDYGTVQNDRSFDGKTYRLRDGFDTSRDNTFIRMRLEKEDWFTGMTYWDKKDGLGSYVPSYEYFTNTPGKRYQVHHNGYLFYAGHESVLTRKLSLMDRVYFRGNSVRPDTGFLYTYRFQDVLNPRDTNGNPVPPQPDLCKCYYSEGKLAGFESQLNYRILPDNEITAGLQAEQTQSQDFLITQGYPQSSGSNETSSSYTTSAPFFKSGTAKVFYSGVIGAYLQDEQRFLEHYSATLGFRYDEFTNVAGQDRIRFGGRTVSDGVLTPRAALIGNPWRPFHFKLLYGEAFKSPTVFQLFDEFRGNPDLKPQEIKTYEAIAIYKFPKGSRIKLGYFFSKLGNVIEERPNDGSRPIGSAGQHENFYQNVEATHIYGASALVELRLNPDFYLYAEYNYTADRDPKTPFRITVDQKTKEITKIEPLEDGSEIDNIAMRKANLGFNYLIMKKLNWNMRLNWVGRRKAPKSNKYFQPYDLNFIEQSYPYEIEGTPDGYMSGYTLVHLTLTWKDWFSVQDLDWQILVRNLFDKAYAGMGRQSGAGVRPIDARQPATQNPSGFIPAYHPQPRRQIYFRLNYRF